MIQFLQSIWGLITIGALGFAAGVILSDFIKNKVAGLGGDK